MFSVLMAQGKKLLHILTVRTLNDLNCLPEGSRQNGWWAGWEGSDRMALALRSGVAQSGVESDSNGNLSGAITPVGILMGYNVATRQAWMCRRTSLSKHFITPDGL